MSQWIRVGDLLVADDATTANLVNNSSSLTRAALNSVFDKTEFASQAEALSGAINDKSMSPLRTRQAFDGWITDAVNARVRRFARKFDVNVNNARTGTANITFPAGMFSEPPILAVTLASTATVTWFTWYNDSLTTATASTIGATFAVNENVNTTVRLAVVAMGPRY